ncbi:MAG: thioredoxin domain-containing protein, partial [Burkholderiaceae bacterium]|nr:thioredoxin domain-containing protein [Burkholderiaceae bacterium]
ETAEIMNHHWISIKVDREERPDIDMVYMDACQLMTGRGGWPLNAICLPNGQPIYAGTYFPKAQWQQIIEQLAKVYREEPDKAHDYAGKIQQKLDALNRWDSESSDPLHRAQLLEQFTTLAQNLDWVEGGPNRAPKFPLPGQYEYILDYHLLTDDESAKDFLHLSLIKMSNGGIYDTIRGGFCRYSTDAQWFAPHFEKMLYDNAQLISLYARAFAWSDAPLYKQIAEECIHFCEEELGLKGGHAV